MPSIFLALKHFFRNTRFMAWFKFGKQDAPLAQDAPVETVETMRSRAKRRLMGALVLVVIAVVGFPMLFETQPRPVLVDVPIEIPDKNKVKPLHPPTALPTAPAAAAKVDDKASLGGKEEIVSPAPPAAPAATLKNEPKQEVALANTAPSATKSIVTPAPAAPDKAAADKAAAEKAAAEKAAAAKAAADKSKAEAAKAQALLEGKAPAPTEPATAQGERFIVQFGSFADVTKAREARQKVEKAGLKTYAQIAETEQGKRYRVRVGPFATRAEADKAAAKIKTLDLPANVLTL
jgi:DedD protein